MLFIKFSVECLKLHIFEFFSKMQNARINREKEKDPEFRLKKFKINAFQENNSSTSSSRNDMNSSVKSKTLKNKLKESLPAWLIGDKDG